MGFLQQNNDGANPRHRELTPVGGKETASGDADRWRLGQSLGDAPAQIHAEWLVADARQQIDGLQRDQGRSLFDVGGHNGLAQLVAELEGLGGGADEATSRLR